MNARSNRFFSRCVRLLGCGLLALTLFGDTPANAVTDPSSGTWRFTLYEDEGCEGDWVSNSAAAPTELLLSELTSYSMNDKASSWSVCNDTGSTLKVTVKLYQHSNYGGTEYVQATNVTVPNGLCFVQTELTPNDTISSAKVTATN